MVDSSRRLRIAFVGQQEYFNAVYGDALNNTHDVRKVQMRCGAPWYHYADLIDFAPDVTFFFRPELYPRELLFRLSGIKVALSSEPLPYYHGARLVKHSDTIARWESLREANGRFDFFWHFNGASIQFLQENGFHVDGEFVFPVDTELYCPLDVPKRWDAFFIGRSTEWREGFLGPLKRDFRVLHIAHGIVDSELVQFVNGTKLALNIHVDRYLTWEHRVQNMMACGVLVLSEALTPNSVLRPGIDYIQFRTRREFWEAIHYYLANPVEAQIIARNGMKRVRSMLSAKVVFPEFIERILLLARERNIVPPVRTGYARANRVQLDLNTQAEEGERHKVSDPSAGRPVIAEVP